MIAVLVCVGTIPVANGGAQEVRGVAHIAGTGTPLPEASVVLISATGTVVAGAITDPAGSYILRAPRQATYHVRARRIGFSPDSSHRLELVPGQAATYSPALTPFATQLASVRVEEGNRCVIAPEAGATAHRLWEEVQSALTAAAVASNNAQIGFVLHRFERELDPGGSVVRESKSWDSRTVSSEPYASIAAESLAAHGFVVPRGQSLVYYAPDARTLTSDAFARTHCFHPVQNTARPDLIGLAFAPAKSGTKGSRKGPLARDVSGVLWLDRASAELRYLEFEFGAGEVTPGSATDATASGRVDYQHLPAGTWIVNHWVIRMPVVITKTVMAPIGVASIEDGAILSRTQTSKVVTIWQAGGDVISTFSAGEAGVGGSSPFGAVSGRFVDSTARSSVHHGIPGVRVRLTPVGTVREPARTAVTDSVGAFTLDSVPPGDYLLNASAPSLDALGVEISQRMVHVTAATKQSLLTTVPPESAAIAILCPSGLSSADAVLHGWVRRLDGGDAIPGARVTGSWFEVADNRPDHFTAGTHSRATIANQDGEYVICGLPLGKQVLVTASAGTRKSVPLPLDPTQNRARLANISIPMDAGTRAPAQSSTATGRVVTGSAVAPLTLQHVTMLKGVEVVARADTSRLDPTGFAQRRLRNSGGSYIDQKQIEQRGAQRMTDVLRSLPGVELHPVSNEYGSRDYVLVMRGVATARGETCPIQYFLDGQPFTQSDNIDRLISPHEVSAVEVYQGASQVPPQFKGPTSRCGVIAIWTKISGG